MGRIQRSVRRVLRGVSGAEEFYGFTNRFVEYDGEPASDVLNTALSSKAPLMVARFGRTEMNCIVDYLNPMSWQAVGRLTRGEIPHIGWRQEIATNMMMLSGFFPSNPDTLSRFSELMLADMPELDILGSWLCEEGLVRDRYRGAKIVRLRMLEPFWSSRPWSKQLEGKKVLVIHPFEETIRHQYERREKLFSNPDILPAFDLQIIKAVQSLVGSEVEFSSWFDALEYQKDEINRRDFDVAILGCGAYGFPLAAHIKRIGKQAIHMGGAVQLLFGIRGARWDAIADHVALTNDYWVRPLPADVPKDYKKVESGCYW
jgi:hypothetical protein